VVNARMQIYLYLQYVGIFLILFRNKHVMLVKELNVVIFQSVHSCALPLTTLKMAT